jgi:hypothetical protein
MSSWTEFLAEKRQSSSGNKWKPNKSNKIVTNTMCEPGTFQPVWQTGWEFNSMISVSQKESREHQDFIDLNNARNTPLPNKRYAEPDWQCSPAGDEMTKQIGNPDKLFASIDVCKDNPPQEICTQSITQ